MDDPRWRLPEPHEVDTVPTADLPALAGKLAELYLRVGARLTRPTRLPTLPSDDRLLPMSDVAALLRVSESTIRRIGPTLPGYRRVSERRPRWSERALRAWLEQGGAAA